mgnify:CR=1 FL=1
MKNIEKYQRTNDALDAWRQSVKGGLYLSFDEWAHREYEAPRAPTLLEAAEAMVNEWYTTDVSGGNIINLKNAIAREKRKPVRNCDRFATADEALVGFRKFCGKVACSECRFRDCVVPTCPLAWLYEDAEKEVSK